MATKIVLNKKNPNDKFGIIGIQSFDGGKKKKSLGIKIEVEYYKELITDTFLIMETV
jgi:hypothetical protein